MAGGVHGRGHSWQDVCVAGEGVCMAGEHAWQGGMHGRGAYVAGEHTWWGACMVGDMTTASDGTHPTGTHSCIRSIFTKSRV